MRRYSALQQCGPFRNDQISKLRSAPVQLTRSFMGSGRAGLSVARCSVMRERPGAVGVTQKLMADAPPCGCMGGWAGSSRTRRQAGVSSSAAGEVECFRRYGGTGQRGVAATCHGVANAHPLGLGAVLDQSWWVEGSDDFAELQQRRRRRCCQGGRAGRRRTPIAWEAGRHGRVRAPLPPMHACLLP